MRLQSITILLVVLMSMMGIRANAQGFEVANAEGVTIRYSITLYDREQEQFGAVVIDNLPDNWKYYKGNLVIPEHIAYSSENFPPQFGNNFPVVGIEGGAFYRCNYLTSVVIPNSVTYIGGSAFEGCESLNTITIPENVTDIGQRAFYDCSGLKKVRVRMTTPATIDENTFPNRGSQTLYVPVGCKGVYEAADYWKEFASIVEKPVGTHIEFADDNVEALCLANWDTNGDGGLSYEEAAAVTDLGEVFQENDRIWSFNELQYFTGLNTISDGAFNGCEGLLSVIIPNSVRSIGQGAFAGCRSLTSITIPESVLSIGSAAFVASNLKWVTARMAKPVAIEDDVFYGTPYANATLYVPAGSKAAYEAANCWKEFNEIVEILAGIIKFADGDVEALCVGNWDSDHDGELSYAEADAVTDLEEVFRRNQSITSFNELQYFTGLKYIRAYEFEFSSLRSVVIPNSVVAILGNAFIGCGLSSVTIPEKVTEIGQNAFAGCRNLVSVIVKSATPATIYSSTFPLGEQQLILYVPVGCVPAYEAAEYWKYFGTIAEITDEVTTKDGMMSTLADLLAYLDKLYNKLKEKATKDEAPDLYSKFRELEYAYGEMMGRVERATTMEELNELQGMIDYYTPKFPKLESEIDEFKKPETTLCLDVNNDGEVNNDDVNSLLDIVLGRTAGNESYSYDVNVDGNVDIADIAQVIEQITNTTGLSSTTVLKVWQADDQVTTISLDDEPCTTYSDGNLIITSSKETLTFPLEMVRRYTYETVANGTRDANPTRAIISKGVEKLTQIGLKPQAVNPYNVASRQQRTNDNSTANDYLKIYYKDGHTERHYMRLVESISATKRDKNGIIHDDYQMQLIVMQDTTYSYYFAEIDSMSFTKVDEEQVKNDVEKVSNTVTPIVEQCSNIEELAEHINEIKNMDEVEDVWREGNSIAVQVRNWHKVFFTFPLIDEESSTRLTNLSRDLGRNIMRQIPQKKDGTPFKVVIAFQMIDHFLFEKDLLRSLKNEFLQMGFDAHFIPNDLTGEILDIDFYERRMFDYDIVFIMTHGCYGRGIHGFYTSERNPGASSWFDALGREIYDMDDIDVGSINGKLFKCVSEDFIRKSNCKFKGSGPHIVFNTACNSLRGDRELKREFNGIPEIYSGSDAVARVFFDKGADLYIGYNNSNKLGGIAGYDFFRHMLRGYSQEVSLRLLPSDQKDEISEDKAALIDIFNPNSEYDKSLFLLKTQTVKKTEIEYQNAYKGKKEIELKGTTSCYDDNTILRFGFRLGREPGVEKLADNKYEEIMAEKVSFSEAEVGLVEFSKSIALSGPWHKLYYRAFTYDGLHYNWGEEDCFFVYDDLTISETTVSMEVGETTTIQITAGSGQYSITNLNDNIAEASLQGTNINIDAVSTGNAKFTVKDILTDELIIVNVYVKASEAPQAYLTCPDDHHPHLIDLGLPSGTKWACCNVGATAPEQYGDYFAWGEVTPKDEYNWNTYKYCNGSDNTMTKYCKNRDMGYNGFTDGLRELLPEDDAATANWGSGWQMPSEDQMQELIDNCSREWTTQGGVNGTLVTGPNGSTIFLPAAGYRYDTSLRSAGSLGYYWLRPLYANCTAYHLYFEWSGWLWRGHTRRYGQSVRPVRVQK